MHVAGVPASYTRSGTTVQPYQLALDILLPLGEYFQVQDDFLDYSGTPEQIGKIGTDIIDNKCSWPVNTALAAASPTQRKVLDENYGQKDAAKEKKIKEVYEELDVRGRYAKYEDDAYKRILGLIETIPEVPAGPSEGETVVRREVFISFLEKIYKRTK